MEEMSLEQSPKKFWQRKQERYQLILENLTDLISCHSPEGIYQYISPVLILKIFLDVHLLFISRKMVRNIVERL